MSEDCEELWNLEGRKKGKRRRKGGGGREGKSSGAGGGRDGKGAVKPEVERRKEVGGAAARRWKEVYEIKTYIIVGLRKFMSK